MTPVIAIIGRPNVGKSTLFNRLTKSRNALVADIPGVTRDRQYGPAQCENWNYILIDTGGIGNEDAGIQASVSKQAELAMQEANAIIFLVDARNGVQPEDLNLAKTLRTLNKPLYLAVNKIDGLNADIAGAEFHELQLGEPILISASHGDGVNALIKHVLTPFPVPEETTETKQEAGIKLAIVGRPNVGKSTLINRMLGEERVVVFDQPGTTLDSLFIPFERNKQHYTLIDTAGVRRKGRVTEALEKFSIIKTLQALSDCNVAMLLVDAREGITEQDLHILGYILDAGKALVIAVNKWDGLDNDHKQRVKNELDRRLVFVDFARIHFISALHGTGVGDLWNFVDEAYQSATTELNTPELTRLLEKAVFDHNPPLVQGRRVKLRYAHAGGHNPPVIIIHGNQTEALPNSYRRYLEHYFCDKLHLVGTPIQIEFKTGINPFKGRKNKLTPRQAAKRKRLMRHAKKSKKR